MLYAQGMTFGGDFGLAVASSKGKARAMLVCTMELVDLCATCVKLQHTSSEGKCLLLELHRTYACLSWSSS